MIDAVRNLHALGVSPEEVVGAAAEVPARFLGRDRLEIQAVLSAGGGSVSARD